MAGEAYELLAMLMRYVFVLIGGLILFRAYRWMRRDARNYKREMKRLPDAGLVGEMVDLHTGRSYPLPREGVLGSASSCDIRIRENGVGRRHALFAFENGKGVRITAQTGKPVLLDGQEVRGFGYALHGSQLQMGDTVLRVRLFAGLNVPHPVRYEQLEQPEEEEWLPSGDEGAGYPMPGEVAAYPAQPMEQPAPQEQAQPDEGYMGNYTPNGEMTWEYAYSLEELNQALQQGGQDAAQLFEAENEDAPGPDGGFDYQSPLPRRRRRGRH